MEPLLILFLLPVGIGLAAGWILRDARYASIAATVGSVVVVCAGVRPIDSDETWNWLAAFLVLPLPIAFALAAVIILYGRSHTRRRQPRHPH